MQENTKTKDNERPKINTDDIKKNINLFNLIGSHVELSRNSVNDHHGQCPKCGSAHGLHVFEIEGTQLFRCYGCGKIGDAISYVMWVDNLDFIDACKTLDENLEVILNMKPEKPIVRQSEKSQSGKWKSDDANRKLIKAQNDLYGSDASGRNYLLSRGLNPEAWKKFGLGYKANVYLPGSWNSETKTATYPAQPAILIPWYRGGVLRGIRYRFLGKHTYTTFDGYETTSKVKGELGSDFEFLYGSQSLSDDDKANRTLVIVEGEINAMSVWQVAHNSGVDTLSTGSETTKALTPVAIEAISKWGKVIGFVDKESVAAEMSAKLPSATVVSSEKNEDGGKCDANDMLVSGELAGFIAAVRYNACKNEAEKDLLLTQLYDAYEAGDNDPLVIEIMQVIGDELGIDVFADVALGSTNESTDELISFAESVLGGVVTVAADDVVAQAEQIVANIDSLVDAVWLAYKQGAEFYFNTRGELAVSGNVSQYLMDYLNEQIGRNHTHVIATLHRMEYWRNRIVSGSVYSLDGSEKAEANHYAKAMGITLDWNRVELTDAIVI